MPKLFVAVGLPAEATSALAGIQPPPRAGVRLARPDQMHLTLHYIGEAEVERLTAALRGVAFPAFGLTLEGVGQFPSAGGAVTLWAGVRQGAELLGLHAAVAVALVGEGFQVEARPYTPHVTLARCEPGSATDVAGDFLARHAAFSLAPVPVAGFGLFSSAFVGAAPVYRLERGFALTVAGGGVAGPPRD